MKKLLLLFSLLIFISVSSHSQTLPPHPPLPAKHPPSPPRLHLRIHHHIITSHHYKHPHKHYYKHKNHAMFNSKIKGENLA